jgi:hypothetical protein
MDNDDRQRMKQAAKSTGNWAVDWVVDKFKGLIILVVIMVVILIIAKLSGALPEGSDDESVGADPVVETTAPPAPDGEGAPPEEPQEQTEPIGRCDLHYNLSTLTANSYVFLERPIEHGDGSGEIDMRIDYDDDTSEVVTGYSWGYPSGTGVPVDEQRAVSCEVVDFRPGPSAEDGAVDDDGDGWPDE